MATSIFYLFIRVHRQENIVTKKISCSVSYLKSINIVLLISLCLVCSSYATVKDVTLQWEHSIDAPHFQSYRIYYYTTSGNVGSLNPADYAASYTIAGAFPIPIDPQGPKPITIDKSNTQITLHFSDDSKIYYFVVTAVDTRGLESIPTPEVTFDLQIIAAVVLSQRSLMGLYLDPRINVLRNFRDRYLLTNPIGKVFVNIYYRYSPPVANFISRHESIKTAARWILTPVVFCIEYPYLVVPAILIIPVGIIFGLKRRQIKIFLKR